MRIHLLMTLQRWLSQGNCRSHTSLVNVALALDPLYLLRMFMNFIFLPHDTVGVFYAISTLLNQIVLFHYPGAEEDAGRIGLCIVVAGMMGSVCCGVVLDKTHRFK